MSTRLQRTPKGTLTLVPGSTDEEEVQLVNRVQNLALEVTVEAEVEFVEDGGVVLGARIGDGRLTDQLLMTPIEENGTDMIGECPGTAFRMLSEHEAGQSFPVTLGAAAPAAAGTTTIREIFRVNFAQPTGVDPFELSYMEADPNSPLFFKARFANVNPVAGLYDMTTGTAVLGNVTITVRQVFDPARTKLPLFTPRIRNIAQQTILGANTEELYQLRTRQRVAALIFMQSAIPAGQIRVPDAGYVNQLRLIGDDGRNIIGPGQIAWDDLNEMQAADQGGDITTSCYIHDFQKAGRLSYTIVPEREYPNFRAEVDQDPAGGANGTPQLAIVIKELITRAPVNGYATVLPRFVKDAAGATVANPEVPEWAR
jgi:hypothetical protein